MNDSDQSIAAASGPHAQSGDTGSATRTQPTSLWGRLKGLLGGRNGTTIRDDLAEALEDAMDAPLADSFSANERAMLQNILKLREMRVDDVMVPRADIEAIESSETIGELLEAFTTAGHSRLPVYEDNLDHIIGFVHIKDAMQAITKRVATNGTTATSGNGKQTNAVKLQSNVLRNKIGSKDLVRKAAFVPPSMPVGDLLQQMQATRMHMAIVVDEYGGTDGLVTIEDLLESVVGDIEDEHDDDDGPLIRSTDENVWMADARVELAELQEAIGADFNPGVHAQDVDTLGGLLFEMIDRVPLRGEVITQLKGFEFEILTADARRIKRVRIMRRKRPTRARATQKTDPPTETPA